jgi:hypothetical protein
VNYIQGSFKSLCLLIVRLFNRDRWVAHKWHKRQYNSQLLILQDEEFYMCCHAARLGEFRFFYFLTEMWGLAHIEITGSNIVQDSDDFQPPFMVSSDCRCRTVF